MTPWWEITTPQPAATHLSSQHSVRCAGNQQQDRAVEVGHGANLRKSLMGLEKDSFLHQTQAALESTKHIERCNHRLVANARPTIRANRPTREDAGQSQSPAKEPGGISQIDREKPD